MEPLSIAAQSHHNLRLSTTVLKNRKELNMKNKIVILALAAFTFFLTPHLALARYLSTDTGRFMTMDTYQGNNEDPSSLHRYVYAVDDPITKADPLGLWPSSLTYFTHHTTHQNSIDRVLGGLDLEQAFGGKLSRDQILKILKDEQVVMDNNQSPELSCRHAMRNGENSQTIEAARALSNEYVRGELLNAMNTTLTPTERVQHLGNALHTIQDSTSPAHTGFQPWYNMYWHPEAAAIHAATEDFDPGSGSHLDAATLKAWNWFLGGADKLPSDFFNGLGYDKGKTPPKHIGRLDYYGGLENEIDVAAP
jgi:hypothetical protein